MTQHIAVICEALHRLRRLHDGPGALQAELPHPAHNITPNTHRCTASSETSPRSRPDVIIHAATDKPFTQPATDPTHRHSATAIRFVVEGHGAYTTVNGEKLTMHEGDLILTPNWTWHDHGNETDEPMMWLDGLDMPFVLALNAMFYEEFNQGNGYQIQPVTRELDDSQARHNRGFRPHNDSFSGNYSPILNYRYQDVRETLDLMDRAGDATSEEEGVMLDYVNPLTGGPTLPTIDAHAQLIQPGEHTRAVRDTASRIYHVLDGRGVSIIGGKRLEWEKGDTFCAPTWAWREHVVAGSDSVGVLFSFDDAPIQKPFSLYRRQALTEATGHQADL